VMAPVAIAWLLARGERRVALRGGAAFAAVAVAAAVVAVAISPAGARDALRWQTDRPVQVESTPAAILNATGADPRPVAGPRGDGVAHAAAGTVTALVALVGVAAIVALSVGAARRRDPRSLVIGSLAATAAFAAFGKVLSPQYLVWTVPLMALALGWRLYALAASLAAATALTLFEFPSRYADVVAREPLATAAVAVRDALLVLAVGLAVRAVSRARAAGSARSSGRDRRRRLPRPPRRATDRRSSPPASRASA
jgi:hypothetical protein